MSFDPSNQPRPWSTKFADAFRGVAIGVRGQSSFRVHIVMGLAVIVCGAVFRVSRTEWCLLTLCIMAVVVAELFNSAAERLARAVDREENADIGAALDIASGAVLMASLGAAWIGAVVFLPHWVAWWS